LAAALVGSPTFGRAGHITFARIPGIDRVAAARRFLARAANDGDYAWQSEHVTLLRELPGAEARGILAKLWERGGLEDALIRLLARNPLPEDREKLVAALRSAQPGTVATAATALRRLPPPGDGNELLGLVRALRLLPATEIEARKQVVATLRARTGVKLGPDTQAWTEWVGTNHPDVAKAIAADAAGSAGIRKRLGGIDWAAGDAAAGRKAFTRAACAACHNGAQAVGPSLEGISGRFSRDDLITAVVDPNRDVSPRYRVTRVSTDDGKDYRGVVIYEANDGLILQTGATDTVRVAGPRVEAKQVLETSLMPGGLLDPLSDREIVDLFAYLKSLGSPSRPPSR
jgi:putative heme-binding domain-containing protein